LANEGSGARRKRTRETSLKISIKISSDLSEGKQDEEIRTDRFVAIFQYFNIPHLNLLKFCRIE
jgi:hypothetical protein